MLRMVYHEKMSAGVTDMFGPQSRKANRCSLLQAFVAGAACCVLVAFPFVQKVETEYAQYKQEMTAYAAADLADVRKAANILEALGGSLAVGLGAMAGVLVHVKRRPKTLIELDGSLHLSVV